MKKWFWILALLFTAPAFSAWHLDAKQSNISFTSIKKDHIGEVHHFNRFSGQVSEQGKISLTIALDSVATGIEVRDERMKQFLFQVVKFPNAEFSAQIVPEFLNNLAVASSQVITLAGTMTLHGVSQALELQILVTKVSKQTLLVVSQQAVLINAAAFGLSEGLAKLQELASLPSISHAVPLTFVLQLSQK
jgi:polyisoprenoid-binding protein YceI